MLKLVNIIKDYKVGGGNIVNALRGLNLEFRQSEFVSVLGPSGCGKTTLLNIIGGLDHSTSGDLLIYNKSTKSYKDRDWDIYRNHRIGFVFQSYNLIPHQTVLGNVELSLTIAGLSKAEQVERAKRALDKVGLSDQYYKRPNQLSGGQSQRVAIARALVNDPEILLADEPTGALDTVTSKQIMELVKEISKERLVIMVTHNSEIAEVYSTRIIKLLDGKLISDSNPFSKEDEIKEAEAIEIAAVKAGIAAAITAKDSKNAAIAAKAKYAKAKALLAANKVKNSKKATKEEQIFNIIMSTVLMEEGQNKKAVKAKAAKAGQRKAFAATKASKREKAKMSFWTAFKLSLRNLFSKKARTIMTSIAGSIGIIGVSLVLAISYGVQNYIDKMQNDMLSGNPIEISQTAFDINAFMDNMTDSDRNELKKGIKEGYINIDAFVENLLKRGENMQNMTIQNNINKTYVNFVQDIPKEYLSALFLDYGLDVSNSIYTNFKNGDGDNVNEQNISLTGIKAIYSSILKNIPEYEDYVSLIDTVSQAFKQAPDADEYISVQYNILDGRIAKEANELMIVLGSDRTLNDLLLAQLGYYSQEEFINVANKAAGNSYNKPIKEEISFENLTNKKFMWYKNDDIFTPNFSEPDKINSINPFMYNAYDTRNDGLELKIVGILEPKESVSFGTLSTGFYYTTALAEHIVYENKDSKLVDFLQKLGKPFNSTASSAGTDHKGITFRYTYFYNGEHNDIGLVGSSNMMLAMAGSILPPQFSYLFEGESKSITLQEMGGNVEDLENGNYFALPSTIAVYPLNLDTKELVLKHLDRWNSDENFEVNGVILTPDDREEMKYTDNLSVIMSMIKEMVQIITIALIGFTSLSLVVSCVMIAIITYVSVVERIKEIGVIRSLGGRKRDVSNLFTAETVIIGLASGLIGILATYILSFIVNLIVAKYAQIAAIAIFPFHYAVIMVAVSVGLTLISGLLPSRAAAKKDPVVALRTE